jgi:hypothetical protein
MFGLKGISACVKVDLLTARCARDHIFFSDQAGDMKDRHDAIGALVDIVDRATDLTRCVHDIPLDNPTPDEHIEVLRHLVEIRVAAIEVLLDDHLGLSADEELALVASTRRLTAELRRYANRIALSIKTVWPQAWTSDLEREFAGILAARGRKSFLG